MKNDTVISKRGGSREGRAEISRPATYVTPSKRAILSRTSRTKFIPRTETIKWGAIKGVVHTRQVLTYITNKYALFAVTSTPTLRGRHNVTVFTIKVWDFSTILGGCSGGMKTINITGASWYDYSLRNFIVIKSERRSNRVICDRRGRQWMHVEKSQRENLIGTHGRRWQDNIATYPLQIGSEDVNSHYWLLS